MSDVTVVVPAWGNYVQYLGETLDSLGAQRPAPRLLLVDNCSSVALPASTAWSVIRTPRRLTLGSARTFGLDHVQTPLVIFWDADDLMPPGTLELLCAEMRTHPDLVLVGSRIVEGDGRAHHWPRRFTARLAHRPLAFAAINLASSLVPTIGTLMRTDAVRDAGGFPDLDSGDDWVLGAAIAFRGRASIIDHVGRIYRQHEDSIWATRQTQRHLLEHARSVRARISADESVPALARYALPAIAAAQWLVIYLVRPLARLMRRRRAGHL